MVFSKLGGLSRVIFMGPLAYMALVPFLPISGKRTLLKMNTFDLFITITLGSTFAGVLLT